MTSLRPGIPFGHGTMEVPPEPYRLEVATPSAPGNTPLGERGILQALEHADGAPSLEQSVRGGRSVLVVVSDGTRRTGSAEFVPPLLERISRAGGAKIRIAVASGIHRTPTDAEVESVLGPEIARRHPVIRHDPDDSARLVELGRTRAGTPVRVNAEIVHHDRIILTGAVGFHYFAGFSGGRKALVPGLAARDTITRNHLRALTPDGSRHPLARSGRLDGNPVHLDMIAGAALAKPHLVVNSVLDGAGRIERLFVGHWRRAHVSACRYLRATRSLRLEPRDLVVASAGGHPYDINLIQAHKAFEGAFGALRPGGVLVLVARCPEGGGHPDFLPFFRHGSEEAMVRALRADYAVYRQTALAWLRKTRACRLILISEVPAETARLVGAEPAADLEEAFRLASESLRPGAPGWVLPSGSRFLVLPYAREGAP